MFFADQNQPGKGRRSPPTYSLWQRRFGADPNIINKPISTNGVTRTVIESCRQISNYPKGAEIYAPIAITPELARSRGNHSYLGIGRLNQE